MSVTEDVPVRFDWDVMDRGFSKIRSILEGNLELSFDSDEYMALYTTTYDMTMKVKTRTDQYPVYQKYKDYINVYIRDMVLPSLRRKHNEFFLRDFVLRWSNHTVMVKWLKRFFHYLDTWFVIVEGVPTLNEAGLFCFHELVYEEVKSKARDAIIDLINQDRDGGQIDMALLKNAIDVFISMGEDFYVKDLENAMILDTVSYYSIKASSWIVSDKSHVYMLKTEESLNKEKERAAYCLPPSTGTILREKVEHELLGKYATQLLVNEASGLVYLLENQMVHDLSRVYRLFYKIPSVLENIASIYKKYVHYKGMLLVPQATVPANKAGYSDGLQNQTFIKKLIDLHDQYSEYVNTCFSSDNQLQKAHKEVFVNLLNWKLDGSSGAELLASYSDYVLKLDKRNNLSDEVTKEALEKVILLFAYIEEKDIFLEFSCRKLAQRLLLDKSASEENERFFLVKLKELCDAQFTSKMEVMLADLTIAKELQVMFKKCLKAKIKDWKVAYPGFNCRIDFNVNVLTSGSWPVNESSDIKLPPEMVQYVEVYEKFIRGDYWNDKHWVDKWRMRKLTWIHSLGNCLITGNFAKEPIDMVMGTYQAAILMLFNHLDVLTYQDIKLQLNLGDHDLIRNLYSLSCSRYKILIKSPNTDFVLPADKFEFNSKFELNSKCKSNKIMIHLPPETDLKKKVTESVEEDRKYHIDCALVRIMKARKVLGHEDLVVECTKQLSTIFKPDMRQIKKRIEDMIGLEFFERTEDNSNVYKYLPAEKPNAVK